MSKKIISLILCICMIVSFAAINVFADDETVNTQRTISGTISLPAGETAPVGGVNIEVDTRLQSLKLNDKSEILTSPDNSYKLVLTAVFADGTVKDVTNDSLATWESSNEETATVNQGIVNTTDIPGTAVITATFGDKSIKIKINSRIKKVKKG